MDQTLTIVIVVVVAILVWLSVLTGLYVNTQRRMRQKKRTRGGENEQTLFKQE